MTNFQIGKAPLDPRDLAILKCLQGDPRVGISEIARQVELSTPTVRERLQRLVETGVIRGWSMEIDPRALGYQICVYIRVRRVTGEDCFIIKAYIKALENLDELLDRFLVFGQTTTSIVQSSPVPQRGLPVPVSRGARKISRRGRARVDAKMKRE
jgi:Lrp/AsnC family transcriptional regulator, leucine-responsive regulatory protein